MTPNMTDHVDDIIKDDNRARDPSVVDDLLTKEMNRLTVRDRNDIQEEIHGVKCLAVEETPELIEKSLRQLKEEIDKNIPDSKKRAYLRSLQIKVEDEAASNQKSPSLSRQPSDSSKSGDDPKPDAMLSSSTAAEKNPAAAAPVSYIHQDDFQLRFLRCDLFDISKAALRMVTWLDMVVELFGEVALRRPICLSDFNKDELRHMRKGMIQILPYRDRSGRRILVCFPEEEVSQIPPFVKAKIAMYILWASGHNDNVSQEKGFVVLVWFDSSFATLSGTWKIKYKFYTLNCDRIAAIHCCSPDTPHYRFRRSIMTMRAGQENLNKLIFHLGESMEIHYKLQGYGIPFEHVPISWTGKVKVQYLKQWMRIRQALEQHYHIGDGDGGSSCDESTVSASAENIIECPQLQDVVFRQGTSGVSHPGNVTFRSLIESTVIKEQIERERLILELEKQRQQRPKQKQSKAEAAKNKPKAKRPKQLAQDIYEARLKTCSENGRFLVWNNEKGWWNELTDREQICMKIEYMVREFQKLSQRSSKLLANAKQAKKNLNTATNVAIGNGGGGSSARRKEHPFGQTSGRYSNTTETGLSARSKNVIYLQSGTSLFQSQDGSNPFFTNKRQRLLNNNNIFATGEADGSGGSGMDFGGGPPMKNECFGMKFTPCLT